MFCLFLFPMTLLFKILCSLCLLWISTVSPIHSRHPVISVFPISFSLPSSAFIITFDILSIRLEYANTESTPSCLMLFLIVFRFQVCVLVFYYSPQFSFYPTVVHSVQYGIQPRFVIGFSDAHKGNVQIFLFCFCLFLSECILSCLHCLFLWLWVGW